MNELLSLGRMARRLGVTQRWLKKKAEAGELPHLRAGNRYLFSSSAVESELTKQAAQSSHSPKHDALTSQTA